MKVCIRFLENCGIGFQLTAIYFSFHLPCFLDEMGRNRDGMLID